MISDVTASRFFPRLTVNALSFVVLAAMAPPGVAAIDDLRRIPYEIPQDLTRWFVEESAFLTYAAVSLPDGGAAIQASVRIHDPGPFGRYLLDESVIAFLNRSGDVTRQIKVPELAVRGADVVRGFANGHVLLERMYRGTGFLAELDSRGAVVWQRKFGDGDYGGVSTSVNLPGGGFVLIGTSGPTVDLHRLDSHGRDLWTREIPYPESSGIFSWVDPVLVVGADDNIIVICNFTNEVFERSDGWMFRFDSQGNEIWQHSLRGHVRLAEPMTDGTMVVFGFPHRMPEEPYRRYISYNPYAGEVGDWALTRVDMRDGAIIRSDMNPLSRGWDSPSFNDSCPQGLVALPDGGMMFITCRPIVGPGYEKASLFRLDANHQVVYQKVTSGPPEQDGQLTGVWVMALLGSRLLVAADRWDAATGTAVSGYYTLPIEGLADDGP